MKNNISVAIVTRNRSKLLKECLYYFTRQTVFPKEIIVVDNNSSDKTKKVILSFKKKIPIKYVFEKKVGTGFARNRVLKVVKTKLLAFTDDDCRVSSNWIEEMLKANMLYPKAVAIQGKSCALLNRSMVSKVSNNDFKLWCYIYIRKNVNLSVIDTNNVLINMDLLKKINIVFDTRFKFCCEDIDVARKLFSEKQSIIYHDKAIVYFRWRNSFMGFIKQAYRRGNNFALLDSKWDKFNYYKKNNIKIPKFLNIKNKSIYFYLIQYIGRLFYKMGYFSGTIEALFSYENNPTFNLKVLFELI